MRISISQDIMKYRSEESMRIIQILQSSGDVSKPIVLQASPYQMMGTF